MGLLDDVLKQLPAAETPKPEGKGGAPKPKGKAAAKPADEKPADQKAEEEETVGGADGREAEETPGGARKTGLTYSAEFKEKFGERP